MSYLTGQFTAICTGVDCVTDLSTETSTGNMLFARFHGHRASGNGRELFLTIEIVDGLSPGLLYQ